jgi:hypothetical protein
MANPGLRSVFLFHFFSFYFWRNLTTKVSKFSRI